MARMPPPKSPMVCEKHQTGCMWRLYGLFDFRQAHSAKKLISDKRHSNRFDKKVSKMKLDLLTSLDENSQIMDDKMNNKTQTVDSGMAAKRNHNGEKLSTELEMNKKIDWDALKHMQSNSKLAGPLPKKKGKASKTSQISQSLPLQGLKSEAKNGKPSYSVSVDKSLNKLNSAALAEEAHGKKRRGCGCKSINTEITAPQVQKKAADAIINQKFIDEKYIRADGVNYQSTQLSDALEILNSNKELFIKLLQDPNSLVAKRIEDLRESQAVKHRIKSPSDVNFTTQPRQCDVPAGIQKLESCESVDSHFSERIVVWKPGPTSMQSAEDNCNRQSEMPAHFSFSQIKKKLRHAIGVSRKEQYSKSEDNTIHTSPCDGSKEDCKGKGVEIIRRNSPGGGMILSPLDIKKRDGISWERECGSDIQCETASTSGYGLGNSNISVGRHPRRKESESYLEARLLELLNNGNKDSSHEKQDQKTLERVISFTEYDFLPTRSPVGLSPYSNHQLLYENKWRLQKEKISCLSPTENKHTMHQGETNCLEVPSESESDCRNGTMKSNDTVLTGVTISSESNVRTSDCIEKTRSMDTNDTIYQGETDRAETLPELSCKDKALDWSANKANMYEENEYFKTSIQEQPSTSSPDVFQSPPRIERVEDSASVEDKGEHPSPVSVLEHFFVDAISEPAEEHHSAPLMRSPADPDTSTCSLNEHELISEYIQAVLQAASLDWDEISMMCDSTDQLLDPFLYDTVKLQANQLHVDCMLLFDCIDEVLVDVYRSDLRHSSWSSFIKPNIRQLPVAETVINKAMKYIEWHNSTPRTMQQVVKMDIARSGTWMDIRKDAEDVVFQIVEDVLEELIMETII